MKLVIYWAVGEKNFLSYLYLDRGIKSKMWRVWVHPRWQLEQWFECRPVRPEPQQCSLEYEQQHWLSLRPLQW